MAGGKLTPRQKMINMMYLVLTALLALNVQKEVLNAFAIINETLDKSIETFNKKNALVYEEFQKQAVQNPDKAGPWKRKADEVKNRADQMEKYIHDLKVKLVMKVDNPENEKVFLDSLGKRVDAIKIDAKDNQDIGGEVMIVFGEGAKLKGELNAYRDFMVNMVKPKDEDVKVSLQRTLTTANPPYDPELGTVSWESQLFEHLPFIAVIANLTQLQSAARYAESEMIAYLMKEVSGEDIPFNKIEGIVIPKSNYVIKGDSFVADIFLAAFDSLNAPEVYVGDFDSISLDMRGPYDSLPVINGKGHMKRLGTSIGTQKFKGVIELRTKTGTFRYPFASQYEVAEPNVVVSPTKMNVFYVGVENPVEVSVSGYSQEKIFPSISSGSMRKDPKGGFIVSFSSRPQSGKCDIDVSVEVGPGQKQRMGKKDFRVKNLPTPISKFARKSGEVPLGKGEFLANEYIVAEMENFDFEVKTPVTQFKMVFIQQGLLKTLESKSNKVTQEMKDAMNKVKKGERVFIEGIKAKLPDGTVPSLSPITVKII